MCTDVLQDVGVLHARMAEALEELRLARACEIQLRAQTRQTWLEKQLLCQNLAATHDQLVRSHGLPMTVVDTLAAQHALSY